MDKRRKILAIGSTIFVILGIIIVLILIRYPQIFNPKASSSVQQISLADSQSSIPGKIGWTNYVLTQQMPANYNYVGLSGNVTISTGSSHDVIVLFSIWNYPNGDCPATGQLPDSFNNLQASNYITSFIVKLNHAGTASVPTNFTLPGKVPLKGCITMAMGGGERVYGEPVQMTSNINFLYDTDAPLTPTPYMVNLSDEYCTGRPVGSGCYISTPSVGPNDAFKLVKKFKTSGKILSLTGNMAVGGLKDQAATANYPTGSWTTTSDYYVFPQCTVPGTSDGAPTGDPDTNSYGPNAAYSQIPSNAIPLQNNVINGNGAVGGDATVTKYFSSPVQFSTGDCLVHIQKYNVNGAISQENQVYANVQPLSGNEPPPLPPAPQPPAQVVAAPIYSIYGNIAYGATHGNQHYYSTDQAEINGLLQAKTNGRDNDWLGGGIAFYGYSSSQAGTVPVYRLYGNIAYGMTHGNQNYYTTNALERSSLVQIKTNGKDADWLDAGIAFYAFSSPGSGRAPVYMVYGNSAYGDDRGNLHYYTTSKTEKDGLLTAKTDSVNNDWLDGGVPFYAFTTPPSVNAAWGDWGQCSAACGGMQQRACSEQQYGGVTCSQTDGGNSTRACGPSCSTPTPIPTPTPVSAPVPPPAPVLTVSLKQCHNNAAALYVGFSEPAAGFHQILYRKLASQPDAGSSWTQIGDYYHGYSTIWDEGLQNNTTYDYRMWAYNSTTGAKSTTSANFEVTTSDCATSTPAPISTSTPSGNKKVGDTNSDQAVDVRDFNNFISDLVAHTENSRSDFDGNGVLNVLDFNLLLSHFGK